MNRKTYGFTLVEMLVVLVITGILAAVLVVFLRPAIDSYIATQRHANLTDMADTALRRMRQDIRSAVPNSLRTASISGVTTDCFQLVPTSGGGRYRMARDILNSAPLASAPLDLNAALPPAPAPPAVASLAFDVFNFMRTPAAVNDWVVINNQNTDDVYNQVNRARILGVQSPPPAPLGLAAGRYRIYISPQAFPSGYDGGRFVVVPNATQTIIYSCVGTTLFRTPVNFPAPLTSATCAAATQDVVATNVNCNSVSFIYDPNQGATQQSGFMLMTLSLTDGTETISLVHGVHVENIP